MSGFKKTADKAEKQNTCLATRKIPNLTGLLGINASQIVPKTITRVLSFSLGSGPPGVSSISLVIKPNKRRIRGGLSSQGDELNKSTGIFVKNYVAQKKSNRFEHCGFYWEETFLARLINVFWGTEIKRRLLVIQILCKANENRCYCEWWIPS